MILIVAVLASALSVVLAGGRLSDLVRLRWRARGTVVAALALQVLIISVVSGDLAGWAGGDLQLASYGLAVIFLAANARVPWLWMVGLGGLCNLVAIGANHGVMPASPVALMAAGRVQRGHRFVNSTALAHPHLAFLGDNFSIPRSWPLANVFSVGDVLLVVGGLFLLHCVCGSRPAQTARALGERLGHGPKAGGAGVHTAGPAPGPVTATTGPVAARGL